MDKDNLIVPVTDGHGGPVLLNGDTLFYHYGIDKVGVIKDNQFQVTQGYTTVMNTSGCSQETSAPGSSQEAGSDRKAEAISTEALKGGRCKSSRKCLKQSSSVPHPSAKNFAFASTEFSGVGGSLSAGSSIVKSITASSEAAQRAKKSCDQSPSATQPSRKKFRFTDKEPCGFQSSCSAGYSDIKTATTSTLPFQEKKRETTVRSSKESASAPEPSQDKFQCADKEFGEISNSHQSDFATEEAFISDHVLEDISADEALSEENCSDDSNDLGDISDENQSQEVTPSKKRRGTSFWYVDYVNLFLDVILEEDFMEKLNDRKTRKKSVWEIAAHRLKEVGVNFGKMEISEAGKFCSQKHINMGHIYRKILQTKTGEGRKRVPFWFARWDAAFADRQINRPMFIIDPGSSDFPPAFLEETLSAEPRKAKSKECPSTPSEKTQSVEDKSPIDKPSTCKLDCNSAAFHDSLNSSVKPEKVTNSDVYSLMVHNSSQQSKLETKKVELLQEWVSNDKSFQAALLELMKKDQ